MAKEESANSVLELYVRRRAILQSLIYVREQIVVLSDHVLSLEKLIQDIEQGRLPSLQERGEAA